MLTPYRRHLAECPGKSKGQAFTLCECPIWCYGRLPGETEPIRRSLQTSDWERAKQRIEHLKLGESEGFFAREHAVTLPTAVRQFLDSCRRRSLAESTLETYERSLDHLKAHFGERAIGSITVPLLDGFAATRKVKPRTWGKELEHLRAFFAWCRDRKWIEDNPAKRLRMPRVTEPATLPFTEAEVAGLLSACERIASDNPAETGYIRQRARALVYALLYSGLRISDVAKLTRKSLDTETKHLTLRVMKTGVRLKVLLHADAVRALETLPSDNPEYFFWSGRGDLITCIKNLRRTIQRLGKLAKVKAHPHRFRDTFAVELLTKGADIRTVQLMLGHESVRTTEKHYAHFIPAHQALLDRAAATLDFTRKPARPVLMKPRQNRRRNA